MGKLGGVLARAPDTSQPLARNTKMSVQTERTVAIMDAGFCHDEHANIVSWEMEQHEQAMAKRQDEGEEADRLVSIGFCMGVTVVVVVGRLW